VLSMSGAAPPPLSHQMAGLMQPTTFDTLGRNSKVLTACSPSTDCPLVLPSTFTLAPHFHKHSEVCCVFYLNCSNFYISFCVLPPDTFSVRPRNNDKFKKDNSQDFSAGVVTGYGLD
jgi:hypothetical protein